MSVRLATAAVLLGCVAAAGTARAAPSVGAETGISVPVPSPAMGDQSGAAIAPGPSGFLVVWQDARAGNGWDDLTSHRIGRDVFASRLDAAGQWLDLVSFPITTAPGDQTEPCVAFDGTNYVVVWVDTRQSPYMLLQGGDLYAARVSPQGTVLDPDGVLLGGAGRTVPAIACDATSCLVAWTEGNAIRGARIDSTLALLEATPLSIGAGPSYREAPAIASNGAGWLVAWADHRDGASWTVYGARVEPDGTVLDGGGKLIGGQGVSVGVASDGIQYFVDWEPASAGAAFGTRIDPASFTLLDPGGVSSPGAPQFHESAVAFDGTDFVLAENATSSGACVQRVAPDGTASAPSCAPPSPGANFWSTGGVALAATSGSACVVSFVGQELDSDLYETCTDPSGTLADPPHAVANAVDGQELAAIAFDGTRYLLVWQEDRPDTRSDIWGALVAADGTPIDPAGFAIATGVAEQGRPAVTALPGEFLVTWSDNAQSSFTRDLYAARVTSIGAVLDPGGISLGQVEDTGDLPQPRAASDGSGFFVAWQAGEFDPEGALGVRVSASGVVLDTAPIALGVNGTGDIAPAIAFGGGEYLVVWTERDANGLGDLAYARIQPDGTVLGGGSSLVSAYGEQTDPSVTWTGSHFVVAWQDGPDPFGLSTVRAARIAPDGTLLDPGGVPVTNDTKSFAGAPAATFDGLNTLVAWQDDRSGSSFDVYGARLDDNLGVVDVGGFPIMTDATSGIAPAVASDRAGRALAAYHRLDTDPGRDVARVFYRTIIADDVPDAGPDAGSDSGSDASVDADAGTPESGTPDAAMEAGADAPPGTGPDASAPDAGTTGPAASNSSGACGCRLGGNTTGPRGALPALLIALGLLAARRSIAARAERRNT